MARNFFILFCFLLPALLPGFSGETALPNADGQERAGSSESALSRLIEISNQLSALNGRLQNELQDSRKSSRELQSMLENSRKELEELKQELELLRNSSAELLTKAESSQTELSALQEALRTAGSSLMSLELSFSDYREAAESRIASLKKENRFWKFGFAAAGVLSAGLGLTLLLGR